MDLKEARARAAEEFIRDWESVWNLPDAEEQKRQRRKIADELSSLERQWSNLSADAQQLLRQAGSLRGCPLPDIGDLARRARQLGQQRPGRKTAADQFIRTAEPLIAYWRANYGEPTRTLYELGDASTMKPSPAVKWLGSELEQLDPTLTGNEALRIAFRVLGDLLKSNREGDPD